MYEVRTREPLAVELLRRYQEGEELEELVASTGLPQDKVVVRLRVAALRQKDCAARRAWETPARFAPFRVDWCYLWWW